MRLTHLRIRYGLPPGAPLFSTSWALLAPAVATARWRPPCDVVEGVDARTVRLELGGVPEEDLEVAVYEDSLVVEGARPWPGVEPGARVHLAELRYGAFRVELPLPGGVDPAAVRGTLDRGLLTLVLPRAEGARP